MKAIRVSINAKINYEDNKLKIGDKAYLPNEIDFTDIFIDRVDGYISTKALRFLASNGINLHIQDYSGKIISSFIQQNKYEGKVKIAQIKAYETMRNEIAAAILNAKIDAQHKLLMQLSKKYTLNTNFKPIGKRLLTIEGSYAGFFFNQLSNVFNALYPEFKFIGRNNKSHNMKSLDPINSLLNYSYSVIAGLTLKHINYYGLLPDIAYLHEPTGNKPSLIFDLMEILRPIADLSVIQTLESKKLKWQDFTFSELSTCRLMPNAQALLMSNLQVLLNSMIEGKQVETIHKENIRNFADSILKGNIPSFKIAIPELYGHIQMITKLETMTAQERKLLGIRKNTLWYIQKQIKEGNNPKIYQKIAEKLNR